MQSGLNILGWLPAGVMLIFSSGLAFAFNRLRGRSERIEKERIRYLQLFQQAHDGAIVLNVANGKILLINPRAAEMLGYTPEELSIGSIFDLHFQVDLDRSAMRIADAWSSGGLVYDDIPLRTASGASLQVECSAKVTDYNGTPAVVIYIRDITERLRLQNEVEEKNALVEHQNAEMLSGLRYAQGIQLAMLPSLSQLRASFADAFVIFKPRDVVSGDFYWSAKVGSKTVLAVADCTGHGVPGALLSMTGITLLPQIVTGRGITGPAEILGELRDELLRTLSHQEGDEHVRDGMNIGVITYDKITRECEFSGALCPLYIVRRSGLFEEVKGDRIPIGFVEGVVNSFSSHLIPMEEGDRMYLASDGMADQFGGPMGKKWKTSGLKEVLVRTHGRNACGQGKDIERTFMEWTGTVDQIDDVLLVGVQV
ncbi:MAG: SpoIIE family protein phosphatase [Flavobacteriales bacterium]|nr:SpoIIE family protein phosphatase [Flavobacteriales bacterium]